MWIRLPNHISGFRSIWIPVLGIRIGFRIEVSCPVEYVMVGPVTSLPRLRAGLPPVNSKHPVVVQKHFPTVKAQLFTKTIPKISFMALLWIV